MAINMNTFSETIDGMELLVQWWAKDFCISYASKYGQMKYGLHIMYMIPKVYDEKEIRNLVKSTAELFKYCENWLDDSQNMEKATLLVNQVEILKNDIFLQKQKMAEEKSALKKSFKAGEFNEKEYQKKLKILNDRKWELDKNIEKSERDAIDELVGKENKFEFKEIIRRCLFK